MRLHSDGALAGLLAPVVLVAETLHIGGGKQLFLDDKFVEQAEGVHWPTRLRQLKHRATKTGGSPTR